MYGMNFMAIGKSGWIVIEVDPEFKGALHSLVKSKGMSLKEWFEKKAKDEFPELRDINDNK
jgi:hypothetical protein